MVKYIIYTEFHVTYWLVCNAIQLVIPLQITYIWVCNKGEQVTILMLIGYSFSSSERFLFDVWGWGSSGFKESSDSNKA